MDESRQAVLCCFFLVDGAADSKAACAVPTFGRYRRSTGLFSFVSGTKK